MPLSKRQFELGIDDEMEGWMRQVYQLLAGHPDLAYSFDELHETVLGYFPEGDPTGNKFRGALNVLDGISAIEKRDVGDTPYYAFLQEFDTGTWERKRVTV